VTLLQLVFPLQLLAALLLPQRIVWRGHVIEVEKGGGFRYVKRR
jgi:ceramide glucosyltransferase